MHWKLLRCRTNENNKKKSLKNKRYSVVIFIIFLTFFSLVVCSLSMENGKFTQKASDLSILCKSKLVAKSSLFKPKSRERYIWAIVRLCFFLHAATIFWLNMNCQRLSCHSILFSYQVEHISVWHAFHVIIYGEVRVSQLFHQHFHL